MKQEQCPNCGASDFRIQGGYQICKYCDAKFKMESPQAEEPEPPEEAEVKPEEKTSPDYDYIYQKQEAVNSVARIVVRIAILAWIVIFLVIAIQSGCMSWLF